MTEEEHISKSNQLKIGLAISSLVIGIISIGLSIILIGGIFSIFGIVLGLTHLKKQQAGKAMAKWGIVTSILGLLMSGALGYFVYYDTFKMYMEMFDQVGEFQTENWIGTPAPDILVKSIDGDSITLSEFKGKRVVVDMWATWCGPCVKEIPHFKKLIEDTSREDLIVIGISDEDESVLKEFSKSKQINYSIVSEADLPRPFSEVMALPTTFFIDRNGIIQEILEGYHDYETLKVSALQPDYSGELKSLSVSEE